MATIDTNNRWVYKGSLTTPPCTKTVLFNVLSTVYPIKPYHLKLFKE
jgi:carbonic anhydrase